MTNPESHSGNLMDSNRTVLLVGDSMAEERDLIRSLISNGYQFICATTDQLLDGISLSSNPMAAIVSYNWPNNIGLRAFLLNHHELHSLPIIFSGATSESCPGRDLNIIGHCPTQRGPGEIVETLNRYFTN